MAVLSSADTLIIDGFSKATRNSGEPSESQYKTLNSYVQQLSALLKKAETFRSGPYANPRNGCLLGVEEHDAFHGTSLFYISGVMIVEGQQLDGIVKSDIVRICRAIEEQNRLRNKSVDPSKVFEQAEAMAEARVSVLADGKRIGFGATRDVQHWRLGYRNNSLCLTSLATLEDDKKIANLVIDLGSRELSILRNASGRPITYTSSLKAKHLDLIKGLVLNFGLLDEAFDQKVS
ncbi:MAG: hypothetical protein R3A13_06235 [Bdellovibrionota bacterium]